MKSPVLLSTLCLAIGAALGWFAKPAASPPESSAQSQSEETNPKSTAGASTQATPSSRGTTSSSRKTPADQEETTGEKGTQSGAIDSRMSEMLKKRQQQKFDARIAKLVTELNLTPAQETDLRNILAAQIEGLDRLESGDLDPGTLAGLSGLISGTSVDEALAGLLTDDQKEAHEALQKREHGNKVEARALKELAKLSSLDLTPEQKDQVYDILFKEAETSVDARANSPESTMIAALTDGMGIELDPDDLGIPEGLITGSIIDGAGEGGATNPQEFMEKMKQSREEGITRKVEALRPVLNDKQLEQYRNDLQRKSGGLLGGFLGGFGDDPKGE